MVAEENGLPVIYGTVVILDLDRFKEYTIKRGYDEYKPNVITGTLSRQVSDLASKYTGTILYGLDRRRGSEEAVIIFPGMEPYSIKEDLLDLAREICGLEASITIVALHEAMITPGRVSSRVLGIVFRRGYSILDRLKHRGGGAVYVEGEVFRVCKRDELGK